MPKKRIPRLQNADCAGIATLIARYIDTLIANRKPLIDEEWVTGRRRISQEDVQRAARALPAEKASQ